MPDYHYVLMSEEQQAETEDLVDEFLGEVGGDGFMIVAKDRLPPSIPEGLRNKIDSAVMIVSGSAGDRVVAVWNNYRIDQRPKEVDEHPFAVIIVSGSAYPSGSIVDHGSWDNRTTALTQAHIAHIVASGVGDYFLGCPPEGATSGSLADLSHGSREAFTYCVDSLDVKIDGDSL